MLMAAFFLDILWHRVLDYMKLPKMEAVTVTELAR